MASQPTMVGWPNLTLAIVGWWINGPVSKFEAKIH